MPRIFHGPFVSALAVLALAAPAARADTIIEQNVEQRFQLDFHVPDAALKKMLPEGWEPVSVVALGYPGEADSLPQPLREREAAQRRRKRLDEFVFSGTWGHPASIAVPIEKR